jgi:soluble lytic murein transglycosylase-like protein
LVHIEERRRVSSAPLRAPETRIGRDPTSDMILDFARVSREHALVRQLGDRHTVADLGSTNGTTVNGSPIGEEPVLLKPGDVIELAQTVALLYETDGGVGARHWIAAAAVMVTLMLAVAGFSLWRLHAQDPVMDRAAGVAEQGRQAALAGDAAVTKALLRDAAGILYKQGRLDDVPRNAVMRVAMERLGSRLEGEVDLWRVFQEALEATAPPPPRPDAAGQRGCALDRVARSQLEACLRERIEMVLIELRQDPAGIPPGFHRQVGRRMVHEHQLLAEALARGEKLVPMLRKELSAARMPPLLHYVALIESGYDPEATSPARAAGLWQFMPGTARQYGLQVGGTSDERRDPLLSTRAAARYLRDLAFEFGGDALLLALAGYNRGENAVRRSLKKLDDPFNDRSYWRLVEEDLLPEETARYVTRFVAAAVAGEAGLPEREELERAGY